MNHSYWTRERILDAVAHWEEEHDSLPKSADWRKVGPNQSHPTDRTVAKFFNGWQDLLDTYSNGKARRLRKPSKRWTKDEIIEAIQRWVKDHDGEVPGVDDFRYSEVERYPSYGSVRKQFGSWEKAVRSAGFIPLGLGLTRKSIRRFKPLPRRSS